LGSFNFFILTTFSAWDYKEEAKTGASTPLATWKVQGAKFLPEKANLIWIYKFSAKCTLDLKPFFFIDFPKPVL